MFTSNKEEKATEWSLEKQLIVALLSGNLQNAIQYVERLIQMLKTTFEEGTLASIAKTIFLSQRKELNNTSILRFFLEIDKDLAAKIQEQLPILFDQSTTMGQSSLAYFSAYVKSIVDSSRENKKPQPKVTVKKPPAQPKKVPRSKDIFLLLDNPSYAKKFQRTSYSNKENTPKALYLIPKADFKGLTKNMEQGGGIGRTKFLISEIIRKCKTNSKSPDLFCIWKRMTYLSKKPIFILAIEYDLKMAEATGLPNQFEITQLMYDSLDTTQKQIDFIYNIASGEEAYTSTLLQFIQFLKNKKDGVEIVSNTSNVSSSSSSSSSNVCEESKESNDVILIGVKKAGNKKEVDDVEMEEEFDEEESTEENGDDEMEEKQNKDGSKLSSGFGLFSGLTDHDASRLLLSFSENKKESEKSQPNMQETLKEKKEDVSREGLRESENKKESDKDQSNTQESLKRKKEEVLEEELESSHKVRKSFNFFSHAQASDFKQEVEKEREREQEQKVPHPSVIEKYSLITDADKPIRVFDPKKATHMIALKKAVNADLEKEDQLTQLLYNKTDPLWIYKSNEYDNVGYGAVANQEFKKYQFIIEYRGVLGNQKPVKKCSELEQAYMFNVNNGKGKVVYAHEVSGLARFLNHSSTQDNVYAEVEGDKIYLKAKTSIAKGQSLYLDYGTGYHFSCEPQYLNLYQNHQVRNEFVIDYGNYYSATILPITDEMRAAFGIEEYEGDHLVMPKMYFEFDEKLNNHPNLPVILATLNKKALTVHEKQPYITPLMVACFEKNAEAIRNIAKAAPDFHAVTKEGINAIHIAFRLSKNAEQFKTFNPLIEALFHALGSKEALVEFIDMYVAETDSKTKAIQNHIVSYVKQLNKNSSSKEGVDVYRKPSRSLF